MRNYTPNEKHRFWSKVVIAEPDDCWEWRAGKTSAKYGAMNIGGKAGGMVLAHRIAYELTYGPIPAGLCICHSCDTPCCVNPAHLFIGTKADNTHDMMTKKRSPLGDRNGSHTHPEKTPKGTAHYKHKFTEKQIRAIRAEYMAGDTTQWELAQRFNVGREAICKIVRYKTWRHVK